MIKHDTKITITADGTYLNSDSIDSETYITSDTWTNVREMN
jgi:hypothetical protein